MNVRQKLVAGLGTVALSIGAGTLAVTAPAQAAPASAQSVSYFYLLKDFNNEQAAYPGNTTRNLCIDVTGLDTEFVQNDTPTAWFVFHTGTCNGSHEVIYSNPGAFLEPPFGYGGGSIHGIMRTSITN